MTIWQEIAKNQPFFALAPMEAVTDVVFRHVVTQAARPDVFFTEFTNVSSFASPEGRASTRGRLEFTPDEQPIIPQIWGSRPADFETTAHGLKAVGYRAIDINMGCPDKAVVKTGGGSALIQDFANKAADGAAYRVVPCNSFTRYDPVKGVLAGEIIAATKTAGLPVSVKTRLGYSKVDEWHDWLSFLFSQDLACLTVHLRTKKEMSKVDAHYELIPEIIKLRDQLAPQTLLMINGDITGVLQGRTLYREYPGIDGIMIGRGVFTNPFCFEKTPEKHNREELIGLLKYHLDEFDNINAPAPHHHFSSSLPSERRTNGDAQETRPPRSMGMSLGADRLVRADDEGKGAEGARQVKFDPLKRFFKIYIREFPGANELRAKLMETKTTTEVRDILEAWKTSQK